MLHQLMSWMEASLLNHIIWGMYKFVFVLIFMESSFAHIASHVVPWLPAFLYHQGQLDSSAKRPPRHITRKWVMGKWNSFGAGKFYVIEHVQRPNYLSSNYVFTHLIMLQWSAFHTISSQWWYCAIIFCFRARANLPWWGYQSRAGMSPLCKIM